MSSTAVARTAPGGTPVEFEPMVKRYWRDLYRYAYRLSGNRHTAEDLVQESFTRAWRSFGALQNRQAVKCWLYTILRRENARRFERYEPVQSEIAPDDIDAKRKTYDTSTEAFVLRRAIRALSAEYREPLVLQVIHGYSQQEIAERMGLTSAGVATRLFRARQKLRAALGEYG
jgi:RNA polymerase sigma-70 factor (ECF subfamily)